MTRASAMLKSIRAAATKRRRKKLEKTVENACVEKARELGWEARKMNGLGFNSWPDRLFIPPKTAWPLTPGKPFWVEFKRPGEEPTEGQSNLHEDLRARGESVFVFDTVDEFLGELKRRSPQRVKKCAAG